MTQHIRNWGLDRIDQISPILNNTFNNNNSGENTNVYIVGSGVLLNHDEYKNRIKYVYDYYRDISDSLYGYPDNDTSFKIHEKHGIYDECPINENCVEIIDDRGTLSAGLIAGTNVGVAKKVFISPVRIFNKHATTKEILSDALSWIISKHNSDIYSSVVLLDFNFDNFDYDIEQDVSDLISNGIIVVAPSGDNSNDAYYTIPAGIGSSKIYTLVNGKHDIKTTFDFNKKPIVVGASTRPVIDNYNGDMTLPECNFGESIDIFAPGGDIYSSSIISDGVSYNFSQTGAYRTQSSSNNAAALVAGAIACYLDDYPSYNHLQTRSLLVNEYASKGLFNSSILRNDRSLDDYDGVEFYNSKVSSPNLLLNIWNYDTEISWVTTEENFIIESLEENTTIFNFVAKSISISNDILPISYNISEYNDPIPSWIIVNEYFRETSRIGTYSIGDYVANLRIDAPVVSDDMIIPPFYLEATDGRKTIKKLIYLTIKNIKHRPVWSNPETGLLYNVEYNDTIDGVGYEFVATDLDNTNITYSIIPIENSLPEGLSLIDDKIVGTVGIIPKTDTNIKRYEFIIRATNIYGLFEDRYFYIDATSTNISHYFEPVWLNSLPTEIVGGTTFYDLGTFDKGEVVKIPVEIINPDDDVLEFFVENNGTIIPSTNVFDGITPYKIVSDDNGRLIGIVDITNKEGKYYFDYVVKDGAGIEIRESFFITVTNVIINDIPINDQIIWITPAGNIGSLLETFSSHCLVEAYNPVGGKITYDIVNGYGNLPNGLLIDINSGNINGLCDFVTDTTTFSFRVRASLGTNFSDRDFDIIVKKIYDNKNIINIDIPLYGKNKIDYSVMINESINKDYLFKPMDPYHGFSYNPSIQIINGLKVFDNYTPEMIIKRMEDYHHELSILIGPYKYAKAIDDNGKYVYDAIYCDIIDNSSKAGGFDSENNEYGVYVPYVLNNLERWNLVDGTQQFFPNSINNFRKDFINIENRQDWLNPDGSIREFATDRGIGLDTIEGLPLWMTTPQADDDPSSFLGYIPSLVVAYVKPNYGLRVVMDSNSKNSDKIFSGMPVRIDRYILTKITNDISSMNKIYGKFPPGDKF